MDKKNSSSVWRAKNGIFSFFGKCHENGFFGFFGGEEF